MRVVLIHQYFRTPIDGGGIRSYYLAKGLIENAHQLEVITAHNDRAISKVFEGITIHYLPVYYDNKLGPISRISAFVKFVILATYKAFRIKSGDINYVISTPLSVGLIALILKTLRRTPYIFEIGDLWPEAPIQLGYIKNTVLKKTLYWFEKLIYRRSKMIVAMSADIEDYVLKSQPSQKLLMIPNMADCEFYNPSDKSEFLLKRYDVIDKFVITYIGTAGRANQLEYLVEAAKACRVSLPQVQFLLAASGRELTRIRTLVEDYGLSNVRFIEYQNRDGVRDILNITDAVYVSFANVPILASGSPNKFFDGLAAGKMIITNFEGWTKRVIDENECGFSYYPSNLNLFVDELSKYLNSEERFMKTKLNSRLLAEMKYSRQQLIKEWLQLFS